MAHLEQSSLGQNNQGHSYSECPSHMSHGHCTYLDTEDRCKHYPGPRLEVPCQPNRTPGTNETAQICKIVSGTLLDPVVAYKQETAFFLSFFLLTHIDAVFQIESPPSSSPEGCQGSRCWLGEVQLSNECSVLNHLCIKELKGSKWPQSRGRTPDGQNLMKSLLMYSPR